MVASILEFPRLQMMAWTASDGLLDRIAVLGDPPFGESKYPDLHAAIGAQYMPPIFSSSNNLSLNVVYYHSADLRHEIHPNQPLFPCPTSIPIHPRTTALYFLTPFLWVATLLVLTTLLGSWTLNPAPSSKDLGDSQEHGEKTAAGDTPKEPHVCILSKEVGPTLVPYPMLVYFGSSRHKAFFASFRFAFRFASPKLSDCCGHSDAPACLSTDLSSVSDSDRSLRVSDSSSEGAMLPLVSHLNERPISQLHVSASDDAIHSIPGAFSYRRHPEAIPTKHETTRETQFVERFPRLLDFMLDELEHEVLDRSLASSMHAPNPEECHPSYAHLVMLGSKGECRSLAASLHSPYRLFPGLAYVRNGEVHYLADVFPTLTLARVLR